MPFPVTGKKPEVTILSEVRQGKREMSALGFPGSSEGKESVCNARDLESIPGSERSGEKENDYPLQYSCLENSMDRVA